MALMVMYHVMHMTWYMLSWLSKLSQNYVELYTAITQNMIIYHSVMAAGFNHP